MRHSPEISSHTEATKGAKPAVPKKELPDDLARAIERDKKRVQSGEVPFDDWETGTGLPKDWLIKTLKRN